MQGAARQSWVLDTWWGPLVAAIAMQAAATIAYILPVIVLGDAQELHEIWSAPRSFWAYVGQYALYIAVGLVLPFTLIESSRRREALGLTRPTISAVEIAAACLAALSINILGGYLIYFLASMAGESFSWDTPFESWHSAPSRPAWFVSLIVFAVGAGVTEELALRGLVQRAWLRRWHPGVAIGAAGLLFALMHKSPAHALSVLGVGCWFGYIAWKTDSTVTSMIVHVFTIAALMMMGQLYHAPGLGQGIYMLLIIAATIGGLFAAVWLVKQWNARPPRPPDPIDPPSPAAQPATIAPTQTPADAPAST